MKYDNLIVKHQFMFRINCYEEKNDCYSHYIYHDTYFAACGQNDISDQDESDTSLIMEDTTIAPLIEHGEIRDGVYKNVLWGIGCTIDDRWTFPTEEQNNERDSVGITIIPCLFTISTYVELSNKIISILLSQSILLSVGSIITISLFWTYCCHFRSSTIIKTGGAKK